MFVHRNKTKISERRTKKLHEVEQPKTKTIFQDLQLLIFTKVKNE